MNPQDFKQAQDRLEARYRRAQESAQRKFAFAVTGVLSPANREILRNFESRLAVIDSGIDAMYRKVESTLLSQKNHEQNISPAITVEMKTVADESAARITPSDNPLRGLSVRALHKLEKLDSHLRHSVVEICLNNLKMFAQLAPAKSQDANFVEKVLRCIPAYPAAAREISLLFERALEDGVRLKDLFSAEYGILANNLSDINVILEIAGERKIDLSFWRRFARAIPGLIEGVLHALGAVTAALSGIRLPLLPLLHTAVDLFRPHTEEKGVLVRLFDQTDSPPRIFARGQGLLNSFIELLRNACKYAFEESGHNDKIIAIRLSYPDKDRRRVRIEVSDNGSGIPRDILPRLGQRGVSTGGSGEGFAMVESIIRREHLGEIAVKSSPGKGTRIDIILPVKIDLPD